MDKIALITGANRGLGFEFVRQLLHKNYRVVATARNVAESHELLALVKANPNLCEFHELDVTKSASLEHLELALSKLPRIDWLINNAGTFGTAGVTTLKSTSSDYEEVFRVNVMGPLRVTQVCLPLLEKSPKPVLASVTSLMGSISDNSSGGYGPYRVSKAGLNMLNKNLSVEHRKLTCVVLHPGWVQTRMGGAQAPLRPNESVEGMIKVIESVDPRHTGKFFDYTGKNLEW